MYEYIDQVLGNYFSAGTGHSEEDAISILRKHIANSIEFSQRLRGKVVEALAYRGYSWKGSLLKHDVLCLDDEDDARTYARRILWDAVFAA